MRLREVLIFVVVIMLLLVLSGCGASGVSMPYSSEEYEQMNWSLDAMIAHFEEIGFSEIKTDIWETYDENDVKICRVAIEDTSSDSWSTEYRDFEKGEKLSTHLKLYISAYTLVPLLSVDNCPEFAVFVNNGMESPESTEEWIEFLKVHKGEALEFDGTITSWSDEFWYISGVRCTIAVEDSEYFDYSWEADSVDDLGLTGKYSHEYYHEGLITEGMNVHVALM